MYWIYAWHDSDIMDYFNASYNDTASISFPKEIFSSPTEERLAYDLIHLARHCGSSFVDWKRIAKIPVKESCNYDKLIAGGFALLEENYIRTHAFSYYVKIPLKNMRKAIFENHFSVRENIAGYSRMIMSIRTVFILLGLIACLVYRHHDLFKMIFLFYIVHLIFFCAILRQVEIRYFFQADVMLWIAACCLLSGKFFLRKDASLK
jgi:hypothetical protein